MTKEHTSEEIKYRLSDLGVQIGDIAIEYITGLEKENAELKEKLNIRSCQNCKHNNKSCPSDGSCKNYSKWEGFENPQLTKAKTYLKYFIEILKKLGVNKEPLVIEAEQFLSEVNNALS